MKMTDLLRVADEQLLSEFVDADATEEFMDLVAMFVDEGLDSDMIRAALAAMERRAS